MSLHNRAECGCWVGPWFGVQSPPRCPRHRDSIRLSRSVPSIPSIPSTEPMNMDGYLAQAQRRLDEARQLREQSAALASLSFESAAALSIAKLSDRAANALANDEMAEHDLLQEAIELLHEAMRTADRARKARSG